MGRATWTIAVLPFSVRCQFKSALNERLCSRMPCTDRPHWPVFLSRAGVHTLQGRNRSARQYTAHDFRYGAT